MQQVDFAFHIGVALEELLHQRLMRPAVVGLVAALELRLLPLQLQGRQVGLHALVIFPEVLLLAAEIIVGNREQGVLLLHLVVKVFIMLWILFLVVALAGNLLLQVIQIGIQLVDRSLRMHPCPFVVPFLRVDGA